ncbi:hypothetical protein ZIOFF_011755 [Zingiber officinale]|uniref:Pentatricopeptide repeat-containing protein n=1 Tax=Zingiber officinale TaxID=94328 RepID=A0A8J5LZX4_ZINOF|nr:hypothetical protein ZIOFF_011755 [Zingiber officinale]
MSSSRPLLGLVRRATTSSHARQVHAQIILCGLPLHNHLLCKLAELRSSDYALAVFRRLPSPPNDHAYASLIRAFSASGPFDFALSLYSRMLLEGVRPTNFTYPPLLNSCSALSSANLGRQVHAHVVKLGFIFDLYVGNSLIDMYSKCLLIDDAHQVLEDMPVSDEVSYNSLISGYARVGDMNTARSVFEEMPHAQNVVCWTALIDGFGKHGMISEMLDIFKRMLVSAEHVLPNSATMVCLLSACANASNWEVGKWVAGFIEVNMITLDSFLSTALVDMYARCGDVGKARKVFDSICDRNVGLWNAMITGYLHGGSPEDAVRLYHHMRKLSVEPNEITMVNLLSACASLGALDLGREVHRTLARKRMQMNVILATALVDMYSKCGGINDACLVYVKAPNKDVVLWNAMIAGLTVHGYGKDALTVFVKMERLGVRPNDSTFVSVLSACSHSGLVEEGKANFHKLLDYGLNPRVEHYACLVDLLGRAGDLSEAVALIQRMVVPPNSAIWSSLLSACRIHGNVQLASEVGRLVLSSGEASLGCCKLLSNIFASVSSWTDVARVRKLIHEKAMMNISSCSWIEVHGTVYRFLVEDTKLVRYQQLYTMLTILMRQLGDEGYQPDSDNLGEHV